MLKREALPLYGPRLAKALAAPQAGAIITVWPNRASDAGEEVELGWEQLYDVLQTRRPFRGASDHPVWSPATFVPAIRAIANIRSISAVLLVFPNTARIGMSEFISAWSSHAGMVVTSPDHDERAPSFAAMLTYNRLVSLTEHQATVTALQTEAARERRPFDPRARNPARYIFLPGAVPGRTFSAQELGGTPIAPLSR